DVTKCHIRSLIVPVGAIVLEHTGLGTWEYPAQTSHTGCGTFGWVTLGLDRRVARAETVRIRPLNLLRSPVCLAARLALAAASVPGVRRDGRDPARAQRPWDRWQWPRQRAHRSLAPLV